VLQTLFWMVNDGTLVNSNQSASSALPSISPSTLPLKTLEEILQNRIIQKKGEMHKSHNRVYNDSLSTSWMTYGDIFNMITIFTKLTK
jgi:hypothetical protein